MISMAVAGPGQMVIWFAWLMKSHGTVFIANLSKLGNGNVLSFPCLDIRWHRDSHENYGSHKIPLGITGWHGTGW